LHQVFKASFDCKECLHDSFIEQKLSYIYNNPCTGVWNLAESPINYWHSKAKFYHTGEQCNVGVTNYKELLDVRKSYNIVSPELQTQPSNSII
jgi:hypothetical protein